MKYECKCILEYLRIHDTRNMFFFSETIGIRLSNRDAAFGDDELGLLDAFWLGMIPSFIDKIIQHRCMGNIEVCMDDKTRLHCTTELTKIWNEIKGFILGRAIGIHRIITQISNDIELVNQKQYNVPSRHNFNKRKNKNKMDGTAALVMDYSCKRGKTEKLHTTIQISGKENNKTIDTSTDTMGKVKFCQGITCGREKHIWCGGSNFSINRININSKHCERCSRFLTSLTQAATALQTVLHRDTNGCQQDIFIETFNQYQNKRINYTLLMQLLNQSPSFGIENKATDTNKIKVRDRQKLIIRNILVALKNCNASHKSANEHLALAATFIHKILHTSNLHMQKQKEATVHKHSSTISTKVESQNKDKQNPIILSKDSDGTSPQHSCKLSPLTAHQHCLSTITNNPITNITSEPTLQATLTRTAGELMTGKAMLYAIEVIRHLSVQTVFVANSGAAEIISKWHHSDGWHSFARIFNSKEVISRKPNGLYLIPLFYGQIEAGHWAFTAIFKNNTFYDAYTIDSANLPNEDNENHRNIRLAFATNRGHFEWTHWHSIQQSEMECGSRTIIAMHNLCKGVACSIPIATNIREASLYPLGPIPYNSQEIRAIAANIIQSYRDDMRSERIRSKEMTNLKRSTKRTRAPIRHKQHQEKKQNCNHMSPN